MKSNTAHNATTSKPKPGEAPRATDPNKEPRTEAPKAATATEQTHRKPATERKQQRPIKQPRKKKNGTTGQILNRPTEVGQTADGATGTRKIV